MRQLTQNDIDIFLLEIQQEIYKEACRTKSESREAVISGGKAISVDEGLLFSEFAGLHLDDGLYNGARPFSEGYITDCLSSQFNIAGMESQLMEASIQYDYFLKLWQDARKAFFNKNLKDYGEIVESLKPPIASASVSDIVPVHDDSDTESQLTLVEAWHDFVVFTSKKKKWTTKTTKDNEANFEFIKLILGADTPVKDVTKKNIKELLATAEILPQRNKRPYNTMTLKECLEVDVPEDDLVSSRTVKGYFKLCQSFFSGYLTKEVDILAVSPTTNVKCPHKSKSYGKYSRVEMGRFVSYFLSLSDWRKWVFLLLSYTGARRNEIAKLNKEDVKLDDDSGRYFISINESKTDAGIRNIPLSNKLIDYGFLDFVNSRETGPLFFEITSVNQISKRFIQIRDELEISPISHDHKRRVVHSLRHTFITEAARITGNMSLVKKVVGHEQSNIGITGVYIDSSDVSELLVVVDGIDWL